jgi:tRNA(Leu) C34 or U34 (ribose-2'-O)-methylase TrmL
MSLHVFLWDVEFTMNLGIIIRTCHVLGDDLVSLAVFDPRGLFATRRKEVQRFSSFAVDHYQRLHIVDTRQAALEWLRAYQGRILYASPDEESAHDIDQQDFQPDDLLLFGNEFYGVPEEVLRLADAQFIIPMYGPVYHRPDLDGKVTNVGTQRCLNLSSSVAIALFVALWQLTGFQDWRASFAENPTVLRDTLEER